jgi:hypothetical protein
MPKNQFRKPASMAEEKLMAKGRLLLVLTVLAAFMFGTAASVSASTVVVPVKGPTHVVFIIKKHRKIHKRRRHHHRHHKKTVTSTTFKPITTGIKPIKG